MRGAPSLPRAWAASMGPRVNPTRVPGGIAYVSSGAASRMARSNVAAYLRSASPGPRGGKKPVQTQGRGDFTGPLQPTASCRDMVQPQPGREQRARGEILTPDPSTLGTPVSSPAPTEPTSPGDPDCAG